MKALQPNAGGEVPAHVIARYRRNFRMVILPALSGLELAGEMDFYWGWIREIRQGTPTVYRESELLARLRACRNEAILHRAWDAHDFRSVRYDGEEYWGDGQR